MEVLIAGLAEATRFRVLVVYGPHTLQGEFIVLKEINPYKFSRCIIFSIFAGWHRTLKIKFCEMLKYRMDANGILDP